MPLTPQSNVEKYLHVIAGHGGEIPSEPLSRVEYYLDEIIKSGGIGGKLKPEIVSELPATGVTGILYLVPSQGSGHNLCDEYFWIEDESRFELLGQTKVEVDLSGYVPNSRKVGGKSLTNDIGITISGTGAIEVTDNGTTSSVAFDISHKDSGVTSGSKGNSTNQTLGFGETFKTLSATVDAKGHITGLDERTVKVPSDTATTSADGLMPKEDKAKLDQYALKGSATKGVYIDANGIPQNMQHELNADVPENFAPATAAPLMDGTATVGTSAKYAREDHKHPTDISRASANDVTAQGSRIAALESENALLCELVNGIDAPIYREASGNPVTFDDAKAANVKALSVEITPTQSGSGDPYPPGGGKNLCPENNVTLNKTPAEFIPLELEPGTYTVSASVTSDDTDSDRCLIALLDEKDVTISSAEFSRGVWQSFTANVGKKSSILGLYASTNYSNGVGDTAVWSNIQIEVGDTSTSYAPYSNIRPITGMSSVSVTRTGKNLWPFGNQSFVGNKLLTFDFPMPPGMYSFSAVTTSSDTDANACAIIMTCADGSSRSSAIGRGNRASAKFSPDSPVVSVRLYAATTGGNSGGDNATFANVQIELGESATAYEPYQGQSVSVQLTDGADPLTVYGGTLNVTTGELAVTWAKASATKQWILQDILDAGGAIPFYKHENSNWPDYRYIGTDTARSEQKCNIAKIANPYNHEEAANYGDYIAIMMSNDGTSEPKKPQMRISKAVVNAMPNDTDTVEITYPIATPITYQLTPQQLATLSGYNSVSIDAGTLSVTYRADTKLSLGNA